MPEIVHVRQDIAQALHHQTVEDAGEEEEVETTSVSTCCACVCVHGVSMCVCRYRGSI